MTTHQAHHVEPTNHGVTERVTHLAQRSARRATDSAKHLLATHPFATVGVALGSGVVIGAVAHKLLEHKPTLGELLVGRARWNRLTHRS